MLRSQLKSLQIMEAEWYKEAEEACRVRACNPSKRKASQTHKPVMLVSLSLLRFSALMWVRVCVSVCVCLSVTQSANGPTNAPVSQRVDIDKLQQCTSAFQ